jgi:hypothetical protein
MSFSDILNQNLDDVSAPIPLPAGTYMAVVSQIENIPELGQKKNPACKVTFKIVQAIDADTSGLKDGWKEKPVNHTFWFTEDALYRWKDFVKACGIAPEGKSIGQTQAEIKNQSVILVMKQTPDKQDPTKIYSNVADFALA